MKKKLVRYFLLRNRNKKIDIKKIDKILFIAYDAIGDMIMTTPVFRELKKIYPEKKIGVLCSERNKDVLKYNPYVDKIFIKNSKKWYFKDLRILKKIRDEKYDICINLWNKISMTEMSFIKLLNVKYRASGVFQKNSENKYNILTEDIKMYDYIFGDRKEKHFSKQQISSLEVFGIKTDNLKYDIFISEKEKEKAKKFFKEFSGKIKIFINMFSSEEKRNIKFEDVCFIVEKVKEKYKNAIFFLNSIPEKRVELIEKIKKSNFENIKIMYETESILDAVAGIEYADLLITPDTSFTHIAEALDKPMIVIYSGVLKNYEKVKTFSKKHYAIFSDNKDENIIEKYDKNKIIEKLELILDEEKI
ncbi:glycosyltransferase family 9 protein [Haliovirga abyssi]|uniref:Lipopolysaccharide heptosyltransferase family protein n=1 Tax=Haliovirga abyssi TaxID=2996794 RepID=A0AAU9D552_9FUSO|nr:glycosyltransferase family 9 protein [Haliovirga abyssi]BDU49683.1 hypothetical protein HLVA_02520 [Haliovirga abyssi]